MKLLFRRHLVLLAAAVLASTSALLASEVAAQGSFTRQLNVRGRVNLEVATGAGRIRVRPGDGSTVRIVGTIEVRDDNRVRAEERVRELESNPSIEQEGNTIRIGRMDDRERLRNVAISYELVVPVETRLEARSGSGEQTIEGIRGPVDASSGAGVLTISKIVGEVRAHTGSGAIHLESIQGEIRSNTGNGPIRATSLGSAFVADTGNGDVSVSGVRGHLRVTTGSGSIDVQGVPSGEWDLRSGAGNITVRVPTEAAFDLNAHTSTGHIESDHPVTVEGTKEPGELRGKVRGGGPRLDVSTGAGNIGIR